MCNNNLVEPVVDLKIKKIRWEKKNASGKQGVTKSVQHSGIYKYFKTVNTSLFEKQI